MDERNNRVKGASYEELAANLLVSKGHVILERNYNTPVGEIDLVSMDPQTATIVFTEVKYRKSAKNGQPFEAVTKAKQRRIYNAANWYIRDRKTAQSQRFRFDVISVLGCDITHIPNAFGGF